MWVFGLVSWWFLFLIVEELSRCSQNNEENELPARKFNQVLYQFYLFEVSYHK